MAKQSGGSPRTVLEQRAEEIVVNNSILCLKNNRYKVESKSQPGKYYDVNYLDDWSCNCMYHTKRHTDCKHIIAVQMIVMKVDPLKPANFTICKPAPKCPKEICGSTNCKFYELRPRNLGGVSERYKCIECGCRFTHRPGFLGRHYDDVAISRAIDDVVEGKSLGAAALSVPKNSHPDAGRVPERSSVLRWMQDAQKTTAKIPENVPIRVSGKWCTDEIHFPTDKGGRYMAGVMDAESRYMLANETYPKDDKLQVYDATWMFKRAVHIAKRIPSVLISDHLSGFARGFKNAILRDKKYNKKDQNPVHIRNASVQKRHINNSLFECQNGTVKNRIKTVRGFNSENPALMFLFTYYNFIRPHMGINNKTPAEAMGIRVDGIDKWLTLLAFASAY